MSEKTCSVCKQSKPITDFHKRRNRGCGREGRCADCMNARYRQWRRDNIERALIREARSRERNYEARRAYQQKRTPLSLDAGWQEGLPTADFMEYRRYQQQTSDVRARESAAELLESVPARVERFAVKIIRKWLCDGIDTTREEERALLELARVAAQREECEVLA